MRELFEELSRKHGQDVARRALAALSALSAGRGINLQVLSIGDFSPQRLGQFAEGDLLPCGFSEDDSLHLRKWLAKRSLPIEELAEGWFSLTRSQGWRLEVVQPKLAPRELSFCAELLSHPDIRAASVYVRAGSERLRRLPRWPLVVLSPEGVQGRRISELVGDLRDVASFSLRSQTEGDLLVVPSNVSTVPGYRGNPAGSLPRSSCAIAIQSERMGAYDSMTFALSLRFALDADAVVVVRASARSRNEFLHSFLLELLQGHAFDLAAMNAGRQELDSVPFLLTSQRFLREARLPTRLSESGNIEEVADLSDSLRELREANLSIVVPDHLRETLRLPSSAVDSRTLQQSVQNLILQSGTEDFSDLAATLLKLHHLLKVRGREAAGRRPISRSSAERGAEPSTRYRSPPRYLHADVFAHHHGNDVHPIFGALEAGVAYRAEVHIGPQLGPGQALRKQFPEELLPAVRKAHELVVVFADISGDEPPPEPQVSRLVLPSHGSSTRCSFRFVPQEGRSRFVARVAVLHNNRVLQTATLSAPVGVDVSRESGLGGVRLEPETAPAWALDDIETRRTFDATLVLNHDEAGASRAMAIAGEEVRWIALNGLDKALQGIRGRINQVTDNPQCPSGLDDPALVALLRVLAKQGSDLWMEVIDQDGVPSGLRDGSRIQVIEARDGVFLPVELFYDRESPTDNATLCPQARQALQDGKCPGTCPQGEEAGHVVCPLGFWGLTRTIERQRRSAAEPMPGDVGLQISPTREARAITLTPGALLGYSHKVDKGEAGSASKVLTALKESFPESDTAEGWNAWARKVQALGPSLLVLIVHTDTDAESGLPVIEIANETLRRANLKEKHVRKAKGPATFVMFLGCNTAMPPAQYQSFVGRFRKFGAAVVLSTITSIRGRHACPTTANIIRLLAEVARTKSLQWGDAFVKIKRELLAKGDPLVLCLAAYGDADWLLHLEDETPVVQPA